MSMSRVASSGIQTSWKWTTSGSSRRMRRATSSKRASRLGASGGPCRFQEQTRTVIGIGYHGDPHGESSEPTAASIQLSIRRFSGLAGRGGGPSHRRIACRDHRQRLAFYVSPRPASPSGRRHRMQRGRDPMRFYEHETKALFARHGLPLGRSGLARSAVEAERIAAGIGGPVVLKSQVLSGGRMKAGAILFADSAGEVPALFQKILRTPVRGLLPESVLVEEKSGVVKEYYAGVTWDGRRKLPVLIFSDMGGIDIEEVAEKH